MKTPRECVLPVYTNSETAKEAPRNNQDSGAQMFA
jgi:hypothetical protein